MKSMFMQGIIGLSLSVAAIAGGEGWEPNFNKAQELAVKSQKDMILDFTGSDWCGWCIKLNKEVFKHESFKKYAADKFVLVELDFPRKKEQEAEIKELNKSLQNKYGVKGFPTLFLTDSAGRPYARTGYRKGGPEVYNKHLDQLREIRVKRDAAFAKAETLTGVEKAQSLVDALNSISVDCRPFYSDVYAQIAKLDPQDTTGVVAAQRLANLKDKLQGDVRKLLRLQKRDEAAKLVNDFIAAEKLSGESKQELLWLKVYCLNPRTAEGLDQVEKLMDEIIAIDSNTASGVRAKSTKTNSLPKMRASLKSATEVKK